MSKGYTYESGGEAKKRRALGINPGEGQSHRGNTSRTAMRAAHRGRPVDRNGVLIDPTAKEPEEWGARRWLRGPARANEDKRARREANGKVYVSIARTPTAKPTGRALVAKLAGAPLPAKAGKARNAAKRARRAMR